jgi:hypothetical protein
MHGMSLMVAVTQVFPIAAKIFPTDIEGLSSPYSPQILPDNRNVEKKVQS